MIGQQKRGILVAVGTLLSLIVFQAERAWGDLQIAGYQDRLHDRFYTGADKAFIGADFSWSGIGRLADPTGSGTNWKFATMISENYFITAQHFKPNRADDPAGTLPPNVRFYRTNDPQGEFWESPIAVSGSNYTGLRIGSTDLWVGKLASPPPGWVTRYPLAKQHEATNYLSYAEHEIFVVGQDSPRSLASGRWGRNEIDRVSGTGELAWSYDLSGGLGADEARTVSGDSGGPSFLTVGQLPVLAGIHTFSNIDTGVSLYLEAIQAAIGEPIAVSTGLLGDLDGDFRVGSQDLNQILDAFGRPASTATQLGDLTGNGTVGMLGINIFLDQYGKSLYAPTDFNFDGDVDGDDLARLGDRWQVSTGAPYTWGDATGDALVNLADVELFDRNQNRAYFGPLPAPLSPIAYDFDGDGQVDSSDVTFVSANLYRQVTPGTDGDVNFNGVVDENDLSVVSNALGNSFGDINGDHVVGPADFVILANNWNRIVTGGRLSGDMNSDGLVNYFDALVLFDWWGVRSDGTFAGIAVPEPAGGSLIVLGAYLGAWIGRRRSATYFSRARARYKS